jgi:hypothetical protein
MFLKVFESHGIRATFFVVGADVQVGDNAAILREVVARGHEIANHSFSHRNDMAEMDENTLLREVADAGKAILAATGVQVCGFRAPCWNVSTRLFRILADRGYRYDSSLVPLPFRRIFELLQRIGTRWVPPFILRNQLEWPNPLPEPYLTDLDNPWRKGQSKLWEVPNGFAAFPPVPLNFTLSTMLGDMAAPLLERVVSFSPHPLVFVFHGLDLVDFHTQIKDLRLKNKPGLTDPFAVKLERINRIIENLQRDRSWMPVKDLIGLR